MSQSAIERLTELVRDTNLRIEALEAETETSPTPAQEAAIDRLNELFYGSAE